MNQQAILKKPALSVKAQTIAAGCAIAAAVVLPQIFHLLGIFSGLGTSLGEIFLPMHLPVILVGLLAGPYAGAAAGLLSPALSFALTGMPRAAALPFMMIELCVYGLCAGLLRGKKLPTVVKVLFTQLAGRAVRAGAVLFSCYIIGNQTVAVSTIWTGVQVGLIGLLLQWALLPLIVYRVEHAERNGK